MGKKESIHGSATTAQDKDWIERLKELSHYGKKMPVHSIHLKFTGLLLGIVFNTGPGIKHMLILGLQDKRYVGS